MLLGLEPGYRGRDERLDKSILAGILALLAGGMSFLLAMTFLLFPEWISPRALAARIRTSAVRGGELMRPSSVTDTGWVANRAIQQAQAAVNLRSRSEPAGEGRGEASRLGAQPPEVAAAGGLSISIEGQPPNRVEREAGSPTQDADERSVGLEPILPSASPGASPSESGSAGAAPGGQSPANDSPPSSAPPSASPPGGGSPGWKGSSPGGAPSPGSDNPGGKGSRPGNGPPTGKGP